MRSGILRAYRLDLRRNMGPGLRGTSQGNAVTGRSAREFVLTPWLDIRGRFRTVSFGLTRPSSGGTRERSAEPDSDLVGLAASGSKVYSTFETPAQSYAIVADAPALNLDRSNRARIVCRAQRELVELD